MSLPFFPFISFGNNDNVGNGTKTYFWMPVGAQKSMLEISPHFLERPRTTTETQRKELLKQNRRPIKNSVTHSLIQSILSLCTLE